MKMYGVEYKNNKNGKEIKKKEDISEISNDTSQKSNKFVPSLEMSKEDKERTFIPNLSPEPKQKRTNFTPSLEIPKEIKEKRFIPTLTIDTKKKQRNFIPSLEMPEKKERSFKPDYDMKANNLKKEITKKSIKSNSSKKYNIKDMQNIAKNRGGECLSKKYLGARTPLKWQCKNGHKWEATPDNIKNKKSWCPKCADGSAERTCRQFFENLFNKKFRKTYPNWLKNPNGNKMHLDGYNKELKLAFEYQGSQHYIYTPYFHKTLEHFKKDQKYDKLKEELCKKHGVFLIKVPYTVKFKDMESFIRAQVKNLGIKVPINPNKINYRKFKFNTEDKLKQMQILAELRGGKLLSKNYVNAHTNLKWQCKNGHIWWASPNNVKNNAKGRNGMKGNWCPECTQKKKYTIEEVKEFARAKGGECISNVYKRAQGKLKWRCENNHEFEASFFNVKYRNSWCPECRKELIFQKFKNIAKEHGGKCLSETYKGTHSKLIWRCNKGHEWIATPNSIKQGSWCPDCVGQHKYTIDEMKELAKSYGGECLSEKYLGAHKHLKWQCSNGHEWTATPNYIKSFNKWCPECKKKQKKV